ncbi:MAG TPA: hypothetical protein VMJ10_31490 [Kofleriaceae bacterium]|nr:hypothetical protein [Kofleriaceae bacterium]
MTKKFILGSLIGALAIHGMLDLIQHGLARPAHADNPHSCGRFDVKASSVSSSGDIARADLGWTPWAATTVESTSGSVTHTVFLQRCAP